MIRRDYIVRMIEEFIQMLSRLDSLRRGQLWEEASGAVDKEFQRLTGLGAAALAQLSETELLAHLIKGEPTQVVRTKTLILATLFKEAGDVATAQEQPEEGRSFYIKGLHLLLDALSGNDPLDCPDFVPGVEVFVSALQDSALPMLTQARLMQHYERIGEFARAEDCLFSMLDADPDNHDLVTFGILFYERLQGQNDAALTAGNLPRPEVETGLVSLRERKSSKP